MEPTTVPDEERRTALTETRPLPGERRPASEDPAIVDPAEHTVIFTNLVTSDKDIVGLVAYSIYKQNKYDWLTAFGRQMGRMPDDVEAQSYLLGESTPRRLATYRHLAEAALDGRGVDVVGGNPRPSLAGRAFGFGAPEAASSASGLHTSRRVLLGVIVAILVVIGLIWAYHGGSPPPARS